MSDFSGKMVSVTGTATGIGRPGAIRIAGAKLAIDGGLRLV